MIHFIFLNNKSFANFNRRLFHGNFVVRSKIRNIFCSVFLKICVVWSGPDQVVNHFREFSYHTKYDSETKNITNMLGLNEGFLNWSFEERVNINSVKLSLRFFEPQYELMVIFKSQINLAHIFIVILFSTNGWWILHIK